MELRTGWALLTTPVLNNVTWVMACGDKSRLRATFYIPDYPRRGTGVIYSHRNVYLFQFVFKIQGRLFTLTLLQNFASASSEFNSLLVWVTLKVFTMRSARLFYIWLCICRYYLCILNCSMSSAANFQFYCKMMSFRSKLLQSAVHWIISALKSSNGSTVLKSNMKHELF